MSLIDSIDNTKLSKPVKFVKNAHLIYNIGSPDCVMCKHYDTIIWCFDGVKCEIKKNLSTTSNRQIRYLNESFGIQENQIVDLNENQKLHDKWSFSGEFTQ